MGLYTPIYIPLDLSISILHVEAYHYLQSSPQRLHHDVSYHDCELADIIATADTYLSERENQPEEDTSVPARIGRLENQWDESGLRRSVDAVMVVTVSAIGHRFRGRRKGESA